VVDQFLDATILVIDDDRSNNLILETILNAESYMVQIALSGKEALTIIENKPPDLILFSLTCPELPGYDLFEMLLNNNETRTIPIIIMSENTAEESVQNALDKGAIDYISKPISTIELLARVRIALRLKNRDEGYKRLLKLNEQFLSI